MREARCCGCGGCFADIPGEGHAYMLGSAGCWASYAVVLAHEYQNLALFADCHRLTVDAYAIQHPGDPGDRRAVKSVWLHFASLHAIYERGQSFMEAMRLMQRLAGCDFPPLPAPPTCSITVAHVAAAGPDGHADAVREWARAAFANWTPQLRAHIARFTAR